MAAVDDRKHWVVLGLLARPHGVRGHVRVRWYSPPEDLLAAPELVRLVRGDAHLDCALLSERRLDSANALVQLAGFNSPEDAVAWRGAQVLVPRELVPPAGDGELYLFELLNRPVRDLDGRALGRAANLYDYGAGPVLGIAPPVTAPVPEMSPAERPALNHEGAAAPGVPALSDAPPRRRGRRRPKARPAAAEELLLPLLSGVLQDIDAEGNVVVDARAAGLEEAT